MASLRLVAETGLKTDVSIEGVLFKPQPGPDSDIALARAVLVALNTDRLALPDDALPEPARRQSPGLVGRPRRGDDLGRLADRYPSLAA